MDTAVVVAGAACAVAVVALLTSLWLARRLSRLQGAQKTVLGGTSHDMVDFAVSLQGRIDDLHDIGLKELFLKHRSGNSMEFVVGAEIYKHLEKVSDRFDDVANEINSIVIEQV